MTSRGWIASLVVRWRRWVTGARSTWDATPPPFAIRLEQREVASGARLGIDWRQSCPRCKSICIRATDRCVTCCGRRHREIPAPGKAHAEWIARGAGRSRLVVAIGSAAALDLGARPENEKAGDYVKALLSGLERATVATFADVCDGDGARRRAGGGAPRWQKCHNRGKLPNVQSELDFANIVSRVQPGETLSDAERAALRTKRWS